MLSFTDRKYLILRSMIIQGTIGYLNLIITITRLFFPKAFSLQLHNRIEGSQTVQHRRITQTGAEQ